jgi:hypothetical protein
MQSLVTFAKKIKETTISSKQIPDAKDIAKVCEVIEKLECLSGIRTSSLSDLCLRSNPKIWASSAVLNFPIQLNKQEIEYLIADFTDAMQTRMREETKYVLGILMEGRLVLCHSVYGEETITPEWKIIPRMLDTDNILRFISFSNNKGEIVVKYWEKEATNSFADWLGLSRKQVFLLGGKYKLRTEVDNMSVEFQLDEEEINTWLRTHPEIKGGFINFTNPINSLVIKEIRAGRKQYQNVEDFIQDYEAEKFGLPKYQKDYTKIKSSYLPLLMKFYDEKERLVRVEGDDKVVEVDKTTPQFHIIFADGDIEIRPSYLTEITSKIRNKEQLWIFHPGHCFSTPPLQLGGTLFFNQIQVTPVIRLLLDYYNDTKLQDLHLDSLFLFTIYRIIGAVNVGSPISYLMEKISNELMNTSVLKGKISKLEDGILEYKSRDILAGSPEKISDQLTQDIEVKLHSSPCKVYCIGIEDDGKFAPVNPSRIRSDRLDKIKGYLLAKFPQCFIYPISVVKGDEALLILIIYQNKLN